MWECRVQGDVGVIPGQARPARPAEEVTQSPKKEKLPGKIDRCDPVGFGVCIWYEYGPRVLLRFEERWGHCASLVL